MADGATLYGMAAGGGDSSGGVVFSYDTTSDEYVTMVSLNNDTGRAPFGGLTLCGSTLYGMASLAGPGGGYGTVFSVELPSLPGDANRDGHVDELDAAALARHWGASGAWACGDFSGDGLVNATDASILAANWGAGVQPTSDSNPVPEPAGLAIVATGALALLARRRRG